MNLNEEASVKVARIKAILESQSSVTESGKLKAIYHVCFPPKQFKMWVFIQKYSTTYHVCTGLKPVGENIIAIREITLTEGEGLTDKS